MSKILTRNTLRESDYDFVQEFLKILKKKFRKEIAEELIESIRLEIEWAKSTGAPFDITINRIFRLIRGEE